MSGKFNEIVREEVDHVKVLAKEATASGTYLYPLKGIAYFMTHRSLWKPLTSNLAPTITTTIGVTTFMFVFTYVPQAAVLAIFNGPLAVLSTILLVLSESSAISTILSRSFFIDDALVDTFDGTLVLRGMSTIVSTGRQLKPGRDPIARLGRLLKRPFQRFTPKAVIRYFVYLPLNFIPVIGTILFIVLQGKKVGPQAHARYFQLKGMPYNQQAQVVEQRRAAYTGFGVLAVLLELIPIVGIFFAFTNTVGAALWASDIEREENPLLYTREMAGQAG